MSVCIAQHQYETQNQQESLQLPKRDTLLQFSPAFCVTDKSKQTRVQRRVISKAQIKKWIVRHQQRKQLSKLDAHLLRDIGYSAEEAKTEYSKPFWK